MKKHKNREKNKNEFLIHFLIVLSLFVIAVILVNKTGILFKSPELEYEYVEYPPQYNYDDAGNLLSVVYNQTPAPYEIARTDYAYNSDGLLLKEINTFELNGQEYSYTNAYSYDTSGNMLSYSSPEESNQYIYDDMGRIIREIKGKTITTYDYDENNRTICIDCGDDASDLPETYEYDNDSNVIKYTYGAQTFYQEFDEQGRLTRKYSDVGTAMYNYNEEGSLTSIDDSGFFGYNLDYNNCTGLQADNLLIQKSEILDFSSNVADITYSDGTNYGIQMKWYLGNLNAALIDSALLCLYPKDLIGEPGFDIKAWYINDESWSEETPPEEINLMQKLDTIDTRFLILANSSLCLDVTSLLKRSIANNNELLTIRIESSNYPVSWVPSIDNSENLSLGFNDGTNVNQLMFNSREATENYSFLAITYSTPRTQVYDENCSLVQDDYYTYNYDENGVLVNQVLLGSDKSISYSYNNYSLADRTTYPDGSYERYYYGQGGVYTFKNIEGNYYYLSPLDYSSLMTEQELLALVKTESCGDQVCNSDESCGSCSSDCGSCGAVQTGSSSSGTGPTTVTEEVTIPTTGTTYTPTDEQIASGYTQEVIVDDVITWYTGDEPHFVIINSSNFIEFVDMILLSTPQHMILLIGEEKKADVTDDNYYDIAIRLNSITDNKINITLRSIHENISAGKTGTGTQTPLTSNTILIIVIAALIIIVIAAIVLIFRKRKS